MSSVRSFILRIYRRRGGHELSGTLEPVDRRSPNNRPRPQAFANDAELLQLMRAGLPPTTPRDAETAFAPAARRSGKCGDAT